MGLVALHVVPRARATAVVGMHGDAVKIRIAAPPADGAANAALLRGRRKTVAVRGVDSGRIRRALLESSA